MLVLNLDNAPCPASKPDINLVTQAFILIVDDTPCNLLMAKSALPRSWDVMTAVSAAKMFKVMDMRRPDLIILDIQMPGMNGLEALSILKNDPVHKDIPVVLCSSRDDPDTVAEGLELGAVDFVGKPFAMELLRHTVETRLKAERLKRRVSSQNELLARNRREMASFIGDFDSLVEAGCLQAMARQDTVLETVAKLIDYRIDSGAAACGAKAHHVLETMIAALKKRGLYQDQIRDWNLEVMVQSAKLHDVGKLALSGNILAKPGKLTNSEYEQVKRHPTLGARILADMESRASDNDMLKYARILAETHQERWDGTGYPHGLAGEAIPLPGRLMAINSVYRALTTDRPWKPALSHDEAVRIIVAGRGRQFDPALIDLFAEVSGELRTAA